MLFQGVLIPFKGMLKGYTSGAGGFKGGSDVFKAS